MEEIFTDFIQMTELVNLLDKGASLKLNFKKCVVVPLRPRVEIAQWRRIISALCPCWAACIIQFHAKYLGVWIGNGYEEAIWVKPMEKFRCRVHGVGALAGAWSSQIQSYRVFGISVLTYVMQYAAVPKDLASIESAMIARVLKIPRNAIPNGVAHHLDALHLPPLPSIVCLGRASMARAWLSLSAASTSEALIASAEDSFEALASNPVEAWMDSSIIATMSSNYSQLHNINEIRLHSHKSPQAALYLALRGPSPTEDITNTMALRILALDGDEAEGMSDKRVSASIILKHVQSCSKHLQPAGVQAWVKALFNAWATSGRFGGHQHRCCFCHAPRGDSLKHFARCSVLAFFGQELVPGLWRRGYNMDGIQSFLGGDAIFDELEPSCLLLAAWLDAVHYSVVAHSRSSSSNPPVQDIAARLRVFGSKFAKGANSVGWINSGISPSSASMSSWT